MPQESIEKSFIVCKIVAMNDFSMFLKHKF